MQVPVPVPVPVPAHIHVPFDAQIPGARAVPFPASHLELPFDAGSSLSAGRLVLPWAALKAGRHAPAGLPVQWPHLPAQVCLQVLPLARVAVSGVLPGGVLLLPAAFSASWLVQLHGLGPDSASPPAGWRTDATWQPREARLSLPGGPVRWGADVEKAEAWSVWLTAPLAVDLRAWFGGCPSKPPVSAARAELRRGSEAVASGRLLPCGGGWGLRIECVEGLEILEKAATWT